MSDLIAKTGAAEGRAAKRFAPVSIAAGLAVLLTTAPVMAQKTPTNLPPFPADPFQEAFDACADVSNDIEIAADNLEAAGWVIEDFYSIGPFAVSLSASRMVNGGEIYFYATYETYTTVGLVDCAYDLVGVPTALDFEAVGPDFGLEGNVQYTEGGVYGAWERLTDDDGVVILADQEGEYFYLQMKWFFPISGGTPTNGGK